MHNLTLTDQEIEMLQRALRVLATEICDLDPEQALTAFDLHTRINEIQHK